MKIRVRTLLIFFGAVVLLFFIVMGLSNEIILEKFRELATSGNLDPSLVTETGEQTVRIFLVTFAAAGGILFFLLWYLLDWSIFAPIARLGGKLRWGAKAQQLPEGLPRTGTGEIAALGREIEQLTASLERARENYRLVVEEQTDLIFRYSAEGRMTFVNGALCSFLGEGRDKLLGRKMHELFNGTNSEQVFRCVAGLSVRNRSCSIEYEVERRQGETHWFSRTDQASFADDGRLTEVQCVMRDVTESRVAQQVLEESERRYRGFFEAAADGIVIVDADDAIIQDVNPGLFTLFGHSRRHFLGQRFWTVEPFDRLSPLWFSPEGDGDQEGNRVRAVELVAADGRTIYADVTVVRYRTGHRDVLQWNFRDVTAQRQSDDALRALSGRLLQAQDDERRRIARELHDSTGQNLSALEMNLSMLAGEMSDRGSHEVRLIEDSRTLAARCCSEIRTISYLLHPPLLDEAGLVFALKWFAEGFSRRSGIEAEMDVPEEMPRLARDTESTLFRVAQEAMTNIHRHSEATKTSIALEYDADQVRLTISDNGRGMTARQVRSANRADAVLGVGLAGMRQRLVQLGGTLVITSGSDGTRVNACVPFEVTVGS